MEQNNFTTPYLFRLATSEDISPLVELNFKWQADKISNAQKSDGFLSAQFNSSDFETLIQNEEVIVTIHNDTVVGYYLLNNFCETKKYYEAKQIVITLTEKNKIHKSCKVGIGAQALIDKEHQGKGLSRPMLKLLCEQVKSKYDYLYSSISKQNYKAYQVHTKEGWFVVDENDNSHYVLLDPKIIL